MKKLRHSSLLNSAFTVFPDLKEAIIKITYCSPIEFTSIIITEEKQKGKSGDDRRESIYRTLKDNIFTKDNGISNENIPKSQSKVLKRSFYSASHENNQSNGSENPFSDKAVKGRVQQADSINKHLFLVVFTSVKKEKKTLHQDISTKKKIDVLNGQNSKVESTKEPFSDAAFIKSSRDDFKKGILTSKFFVNEGIEKKNTPELSEINSVRIALLKRQQKHFCIATFLLCLLLILSSLGVLCYFFFKMFHTWKNLNASIQVNNNFLVIFQSMWNILGTVSRAGTALASSPPDFTNFFLNQIFVR